MEVQYPINQALNKYARINQALKGHTKEMKKKKKPIQEPLRGPEEVNWQYPMLQK